MMKKLAIATLLSAIIAIPASAAEAYLGLNAGQNDMDIAGVKASTAVGVFAGYSFNEYIAGELNYTDLGSADTDVAGISVKGNVVSLSAVGSLPLNQQFSLFAKLGYASAKIEATGGSSETKDDVTYGIGAQFNATKNIGLRLGYDNFRVGKNTTKDSPYYSIAAMYMF